MVEGLSGDLRPHFRNSLVLHYPGSRCARPEYPRTDPDVRCQLGMFGWFRPRNSIPNKIVTHTTVAVVHHAPRPRMGLAVSREGAPSAAIARAASTSHRALARPLGGGGRGGGAAS